MVLSKKILFYNGPVKRYITSFETNKYKNKNKKRH